MCSSGPVRHPPDVWPVPDLLHGLIAVVESLAARSPDVVAWQHLCRAQISLPTGCTAVQLLHPDAPPPPTGTIRIRWSGALALDGVHVPAARHVDITVAFLRGASAWAALPASLRGNALTTLCLTRCRSCPSPLLMALPLNWPLPNHVVDIRLGCPQRALLLELDITAWTLWLSSLRTSTASLSLPSAPRGG